MKTNLANRPSHKGFAFGEDKERDFAYARDCIVWFEAFEKELREKIAFHKKMLAYWENDESLKHNLSEHRVEIASEWRVTLAQLEEVLGK